MKLAGHTGQSALALDGTEGGDGVHVGREEVLSLVGLEDDDVLVGDLGELSRVVCVVKAAECLGSMRGGLSLLTSLSIWAFVREG